MNIGGERTAAILSIVASCIAHDVNPRAYLHLVTKVIVHGWPQAKLGELLPDRPIASCTWATTTNNRPRRAPILA